MIATHNIKVNGKWIHAGESYEPDQPEKAVKNDPKPEKAKKSEKAEVPVKEPQKKPEEIPETETAEAETDPKTEEAKAETVNEDKPKGSTRRRVSK